MNPTVSVSLSLPESKELDIDIGYFNNQDCQINAQHRHVPSVYCKQELKQYYEYYNINSSNINSIKGLNRYIIENNFKPIAKTLQGAAYQGIDIVTGRRVIIKCSNKQLVKSHMCRNGTKIAENIRQEARLMNYIKTINGNYTDSYISKFVDYFKTNEHYYLVAEHGGIELFDHIIKNHPSKNINNNQEIINIWKHNIRYYFRMLSRAIYYLHKHCNIAHLDISLENSVIDINTNIVRIIDFGLAKRFESNNWKFNGVSGKVPYHSPEVRKLHNYFTNIKKNRININDTERKEMESNMIYDPRSADIWALGTMLFIMLVGSQPWNVAEESEITFDYIMNGRINQILAAWEATPYVDQNALDLITKIFKPENERIDIKQIINHPYVKYGPRTFYKQKNNINNVEGSIVSNDLEMESTQFQSIEPSPTFVNETSTSPISPSTTVASVTTSVTMHTPMDTPMDTPMNTPMQSEYSVSPMYRMGYVESVETINNNQ